MSCVICEYPETVDHHVSYERDETIELCRSCHGKVHYSDGFHDELVPEDDRFDLENSRRRITIDLSVDDREHDLERARTILGDDATTSEVFAKAVKHLYQSVENAEELVGGMTPNQAQDLSTDVVRLRHYPKVKT